MEIKFFRDAQSRGWRAVNNKQVYLCDTGLELFHLKWMGQPTPSGCNHLTLIVDTIYAFRGVLCTVLTGETLLVSGTSSVDMDGLTVQILRQMRLTDIPLWLSFAFTV